MVVWWCRPHPVREHAQDLRPPLGARPASPPTRQAAQPPPRTYVIKHIVDWPLDVFNFIFCFIFQVKRASSILIFLLTVRLKQFSGDFSMFCATLFF